jgi:hypothetical protein
MSKLYSIACEYHLLIIDVLVLASVPNLVSFVTKIEYVIPVKRNYEILKWRCTVRPRDELRSVARTDQPGCP